MHNLLQYLDNYPNQSIQELSLSNLQNHNDEDMIRSDIFKRVLQRLHSLRLYIATEYWDFAPESSFNLPEMGLFAATLPSMWIQPAASGFTRLALYWDTRWGYTPKADFRGMHLPQLRHLEMGKWTISHDWQIDWLISHGETLSTLWMDDCHILAKAWAYFRVDNEGYPEGSAYPRRTGDPGTNFYEYNRKWAKVFDRFSAELPKLRDFRFGTSNWNRDPLEEVVKQVLHSFDQLGGYYMSFYEKRMPSPWCDPPEYDNWSEDEEEHEDQGNGDEEGIGLEVEYEEDDIAAKRDKQALVRLLRKIGQPIPSFEDEQSPES